MGKHKQDEKLDKITDSTISIKDIWKDIIYNIKRCAEIELLYDKEVRAIKKELGEDTYNVIRKEVEDSKPTYINLYEKICIIEDPLKDRLVLNELDEEDEEAYTQLQLLIKIKMDEIKKLEEIEELIKKIKK